MFEANQKANLAHVNSRAEKHGDEAVSVMDLKLKLNMGNKVLDLFNAELRNVLYKKVDDPDLVDQTEPDALTAPRFGYLPVLAWDWEGSGYTVTIGYGMGGESDIVLADVKVDKFKFEPMNGGTVGVTLRVVAHPDEVQAGKLFTLIQNDVDVIITAPEPTSVTELFAPA